MIKTFFIFLLVSSALQVKGQNFIMAAGGEDSTCGGTFFDPGGTGNYAGGQNDTITYTLCSTQGNMIELEFTSFNLFSTSCGGGSSIDMLNIYDGTSTTDPLVGSYTQSELTGQNIYGQSGCLTFQFIRQNNGGFGCATNNGAAGWQATILCTNQLPPTGDNCPDAAPFCSSQNYNFPNSTSGTTAPAGPDYGCLYSYPDPVWYYMKIGTAGTLQLNLAQADASNNPLDVDFAMWGPFTSMSAGCAAVMGGQAPLQCSYSANATETIGIGITGGFGVGQSTPPPAQVGQYYIVLITNFSQDPGFITLSQTVGTGSTDCNIVQPCAISSITANLSACNNALYGVSGTINVANMPSSGDLVVEDCNGNITTVASAPFDTSAYTYNLTNLTATGNACSVIAFFTADSACTDTVNYTAPDCPCTSSCPCTFLGMNLTPSSCIGGGDQFNLNGAVTFTYAPTTGQLVIVDCHGDSTSFNAPFTSPQSFTLNNLNADGDSCAVKAYFTADLSCSITKEVLSPAAPFISAGNDTAICEGTGQVTLTATNPDSATIGWDNGISDGQPFMPALGTTTYVVTATKNGCSSTDSVNVTVNPNPTVSASSNSPVCISGTIALKSDGGKYYNWTGVNNFSSSLQNPTISEAVSADSGIYSVDVTDSNGCRDSASTVVALTPKPTADFIGQNLSGCTPLCVTLTDSSEVGNNGSPINNWEWLLGDGRELSGQSVIACYSNDGLAPDDYSITLIVTDGNGCSDSATKANYVTVNPLPKANFTNTPKFGDIYHTEIHFIDKSTGAVAWQWSFGEGNDSSSLENPIYIYQDTGNYVVNLKVTNQWNCVDSTIQIIRINPVLSMFIPNSFTPDGDGLNDTFYPQGYGYTMKSMYIFNRWGELIYKSDKPNAQWNGKYDNKIVPAGVYVYKIDVKDYQDLDHIYRGHVTVIR